MSVLQLNDAPKWSTSVIETARAARLQRLTDKYGVTPTAELVAADLRLAQCGDYRDYRVAGYCNGKCQHRDYINQLPQISISGGRVKIEWQPCRIAEERLTRRLSNVNIPARYVGKTYADYAVDFNNREAVNYARNVLQTREGAFLYGAAGVGKTFLASLIALDFIRADKSVAFYKVPALMDELYAKIRGDSNINESDLMRRLSTATLLILDDFGMEKPTKYVGATLCKLIDMRYDGVGLTTIITSNYSPERLRDELDNASDGANYNGTRLFDRCREMCTPILIKGTSRRR